MTWILKSESDSDRVWAETIHGKETGRYKYEYHDGSTQVVTPHVPKRKAIGAGLAGGLLPLAALAASWPPVAVAAAGIAGAALVVGAFRKTIR